MLALVVTVPATDVEVASDALWTLGVLAVEERQGPAEGSVELWTSLGEDATEVASRAGKPLVRWPWRLVEVDESVAQNWRAHADPTWVRDDVVFVPAWIDIDLAPGVTAVRIEPGETFGMGDHPTTRLTARGLLDVMEPGDRVLDVGCGSGVLAVLAAMRGASDVVAVDIHPACVPVTLANAEANGVVGRVDVSLRTLDEFDEPFDVVLANILAPVLVELAPDLVRLVAPGGTLIVSGILADRHDHVVAALAPLVVRGSHHHDGWCALVMTG